MEEGNKTPKAPTFEREAPKEEDPDDPIAQSLKQRMQAGGILEVVKEKAGKKIVAEQQQEEVAQSASEGN